MAFVIEDKNIIDNPSFIETCTHCGVSICYSNKDIMGQMIDEVNNKKGNYIYCPNCGDKVIVTRYYFEYGGYTNGQYFIPYKSEEDTKHGMIRFN